MTIKSCAEHYWGHEASEIHVPCPFCRIAELEAELEKAEVRTTPEKLNAMLDAARQAGTEAALRWAIAYVRGWHNGHWYGN